jgi:hypothetical protein
VFPLVGNSPQGGTVTKPYVFIDFSPHTSRITQKKSHLHQFKEYPDPNGNRAERRAAKKKAKKK